MLKLSLPVLTAKKGAAVKIPINVTDFNNIGSTSLMIGFDPKVLEGADDDFSKYT
jgi:hypothetical protein